MFSNFSLLFFPDLKFFLLIYEFIFHEASCVHLVLNENNNVMNRRDSLCDIDGLYDQQAIEMWLAIGNKIIE